MTIKALPLDEIKKFTDDTRRLFITIAAPVIDLGLHYQEGDRFVVIAQEDSGIVLPEGQEEVGEFEPRGAVLEVDGVALAPLQEAVQFPGLGRPVDEFRAAWDHAQLALGHDGWVWEANPEVLAFRLLPAPLTAREEAQLNAHLKDLGITKLRLV